MALIFNDDLEVSDGSGTYTLQGFAGGMWNDIQTISGPSNGIVQINSTTNTIPVYTQILTRGQSFDLRWVDSHGVISNVRTLMIPEAIMSRYAFGTSEIGFAHTGGDNWTVTFPYSVSNLQATGTLESMNVTSVFYQGGQPDDTTGIRAEAKTADFSYDYSGQGAGVYFNYLVYSFSDGAYMVLIHLIQVDGSGNIVRSLSMKGFDPMVIAGITISATAQYAITGTVTPIAKAFIANGGTSTILGSADSITLVSLPVDTIDLRFQFGLTTLEWADMLIGPNPSHIGAFVDCGIIIS